VQVHHVDGWIADDGETNIDELTLDCGPDNRLVGESGWTTRKRKDVRTEWIPPRASTADRVGSMPTTTQRTI